MKPVDSRFTLTKEELKKDRSAVKRFGPSGVGEKAVYMGGRVLDRYYYAPVSHVERIWKRIAMSKGGFTGQGAFGSVCYLVLKMEGGTEKVTLFQEESAADGMLSEIAERFPQIPVLSAAAESRLKEREEERKKKAVKLGETEKETVTALLETRKFLLKRPDLFRELSDAARHLRSYRLTKGSYGWFALAMTLLGVAAAVYGIFTVSENGIHPAGGSGIADFGIFFVLFGFAFVFLFAGLSVLPMAKNNRKAVEKRVRKAEENVEAYLQEAGEAHSCIREIPAYYVHPVVLDRMIREIEEGNARTVPDALDAVMQRLKTLDRSVTVDREEYEEIIQVKPMFLNRNYN